MAVTGSVGKTTTKEFIATLLSQKFTVSKTPGNSNSQVALPTAILNADGKEEFFIVEMAMSAAGHIRKLVEIAPPEVAVVTKIGHANIEYFADGFEGIAAAKAEILSHPKTTHAVLNRQVLAYAAFQKELSSKKIIFAIDPEKGDYVLEEGWYIKEEERLSSQGFPAALYCNPFMRRFYCSGICCEDFGSYMGRNYLRSPSS